jgi:flagellin
MLAINTNISSANAQNQLTQVTRQIGTRFERLSSGLRINGAKDDAAGLSISMRMTAQVRGTQRAVQNANDNISYVQTAEGALNEVTNILQRMRELTVQASSNILSTSDRTSIQGELTQLSDEINRINESSTFNGKQIFSQHKTISVGDKSAVPEGFNLTYDYTGAADPAGAIGTALKQSWLRESVDRIEKYYGITPNGRDMTINFTSGAAFAGQVSQVGDALTMTFDTDDVDATSLGFTVGIHEITHAVMLAADVDGGGRSWWMEGTAQFMEDGDERLKRMVDANTAATIAARDLDTFAGDEQDYAAAYSAVRFLHGILKEQGHEGGIKAMMQALKGDKTMDEAFAEVTTYATEADFLADFAARGEEYINTLDLENDDIGIIGGFDADKGAITTIDDIVSGIKMFEESKDGGVDVAMHIGANSEQSLRFTVRSFNTSALNLEGIEIIDFDDTDGFLKNIDIALDQVSKQRAEFGAI